MARQSTHGTLHKLYYYLVFYAATQKTIFFVYLKQIRVESTKMTSKKLALKVKLVIPRNLWCMILKWCFCPTCPHLTHFLL